MGVKKVKFAGNYNINPKLNSSAYTGGLFSASWRIMRSLKLSLGDKVL